jgi:hypothetical protein
MNEEPKREKSTSVAARSEGNVTRLIFVQKSQHSEPIARASCVASCVQIVFRLVRDGCFVSSSVVLICNVNGADKFGSALLTLNP